ncbi:MAG: SMC-Scp complex subunit ScpB [Candidatus Micrarchaeota archaeon]
MARKKKEAPDLTRKEASASAMNEGSASVQKEGSASVQGAASVPAAVSSVLSKPVSLLEKEFPDGPKMPEQAKPPPEASPPFSSEMTVIADAPESLASSAPASLDIHSPKTKKFFSIKKSARAPAQEKADDAGKTADEAKKMAGETKAKMAGKTRTKTAEEVTFPASSSSVVSVGDAMDASAPSEPATSDTMPEAPASAGPQAPPEPESLSADEKQILLKPYVQDSDPSRVLEAALFTSSQSLATSDLARLVGIAAVGHVNELMGKLAKEYDERNSSLEIVQEENSRWAMRVRASFAPTVRQFAGEAEISRHALRTLAYIAKNNGIAKRTLFSRLGSTIYEDVAELAEKGFVSATPSGRTSVLHTTAKFKQYFEG